MRVPAATLVAAFGITSAVAAQWGGRRKGRGEAGVGSVARVAGRSAWRAQVHEFAPRLFRNGR
jgi:hypothetical protein